MSHIYLLGNIAKTRFIGMGSEGNIFVPKMVELSRAKRYMSTKSALNDLALARYRADVKVEDMALFSYSDISGHLEQIKPRKKPDNTGQYQTELEMSTKKPVCPSCWNVICTC